MRLKRLFRYTLIGFAGAVITLLTSFYLSIWIQDKVRINSAFTFYPMIVLVFVGWIYFWSLILNKIEVSGEVTKKSIFFKTAFIQFIFLVTLWFLVSYYFETKYPTGVVPNQSWFPTPVYVKNLEPKNIVWTVYKKQSPGYSIKYPSNWQVITRGTPLYNKSRAVDEYIEFKEEHSYVSLTISEVSTVRDDVDYFSAYKEQDIYTARQKGNVEDAIIDGKSAYKVNLPELDSPCYRRLVIKLGRKNLLTVSRDYNGLLWYSIDKNSRSNICIILDSMISSLSFR